MRNPNYCHIYYNSPNPPTPPSASLCLCSENCDWTLSHRPALICSDALVLLLFVCGWSPGPTGVLEVLKNTFKSPSLSPLDSSRYADGGWDEAGFGLRCLWEPESCQQLWDVPLSKNAVEACLCLYNLSVCVRICESDYSMSDVCACICESQCGYECLISGLHVHSVFLCDSELMALGVLRL